WMVMKRALKSDIAIYEQAMLVDKELTSIPSFDTIDTTTVLAKEKALINSLKKIFLMVAGKAAQTLQDKIEEEQEIMMNLAEILIEIYAAESTILRAEKLVQQRGEDSAKYQIAMAKVYLTEAVDKINLSAKEAIGGFVTGDEQKMMLMGLKRFTKIDLINTKDLRRKIAAYMLEKDKYPFFI